MRGPRILCVGNDAELLLTRCAVLATAGYETSSVAFPAAGTMLNRGRFDVAVLCPTLNETELQRIRALVPVGTLILELGYFTPPTELLAQVAHLLGCAHDDPEA